MKQAERRKYHYIYKITRNDGSGKYYIGMHSTDDLEDGYFGSGQLLWKSIKKYGKEKHAKEILEYLPSRSELKTRERELVNEEILDDPLCMNLRLGGEGGAHGKESEVWNRPGYRERVALLQGEGLKCRWQDPTYQEKMSLRSKKQWKDPLYRSKMKNTTSFLGKKHSDDTRQRIGVANAITQLGEKNSQFGTCWVSKNGSTKKIKKDDLQAYLSNGYVRGRKQLGVGEKVDTLGSEPRQESSSLSHPAK